MKVKKLGVWKEMTVTETGPKETESDQEMNLEVDSRDKVTFKTAIRDRARSTTNEKRV